MRHRRRLPYMLGLGRFFVSLIDPLINAGH
jgi:hypothetical protein